MMYALFQLERNALHWPREFERPFHDVGIDGDPAVRKILAIAGIDSIETEVERA